MLTHSIKGRFIAWTVFVVLFIVVFGLPLLTVALMGFSTGWVNVVPSNLTFAHVRDAIFGSGQSSLLTSLETAILASSVAVAIGAGMAVGSFQSGKKTRRLLDGILMVPIAVPHVVVGLSLLLAFSRGPLTLNGTPSLVVIAHIVVVSPFVYTSTKAALARLDVSVLQSAASLGARPTYVLRRVTFPLLKPGLIAGAGLSFAMSMGELGATVLVYPANFMTQPVAIFQFTDKSGNYAAGGAYAFVMLAVTVLALVIMSFARSRASFR